MPTLYTVEVKTVGSWTHHSEHISYRDAVDQSDMVHGRVVLPCGRTDRDAHLYAVQRQGFAGGYSAWTELEDDERIAFDSTRPADFWLEIHT